MIEGIAEIVKGVNELQDSYYDHLERVKEYEKDEEQKDKKTLNLLKNIESNGLTENSVHELIKEQNMEISEENKILQMLEQAEKESGEAEKELQTLLDALKNKEHVSDEEIQEIKDGVREIRQGEGLMKGVLEKEMEAIGEDAQDLKDEVKAELQAAKLFDKLEEGKELEAAEIGHAETELKMLFKTTKEAEADLKSAGDQEDEQREEKGEQMVRQEKQELDEIEQNFKSEIKFSENELGELDSLINHTEEQREELEKALQTIDQMLKNANVNYTEYRRKLYNVEDEITQLGEWLSETKNILNEAMKEENQAENIFQNQATAT